MSDTANQFSTEDEGWSPLETQDQSSVEAIRQEAKKTFSLSDRLRGIKHSTDKLLLFTDMKAVSARTAASQKMTKIQESIGATENSEEKESLLEDFNDAQTEFEEAQAKMLAGALSVHLKGVPQAVVDRCNRHTDKAYPPETIVGDPEKQEYRNKLYIQHLFCQTIEKIVDSDGVVTTLKFEDGKPDLELAKQLQTDLPPAQYARLDQAVGRLLWTDGIGQAATDDPGF